MGGIDKILWKTSGHRRGFPEPISSRQRLSAVNFFPSFEMPLRWGCAARPFVGAPLVGAQRGAGSAPRKGRHEACPYEIRLARMKTIGQKYERDLAGKRRFQVNLGQGLYQICFHCFFCQSTRDGNFIDQQLPGAVQHFLFAEGEGFGLI